MYSIVSDATTLIILGKLDQYILLENLFEKIYIPCEVMVEVSQKLDGVYEKIISHKVFEEKSITNTKLLGYLEGILDKGESQAIVLAKELDIILLIDEKKGRIIAKDMGLEIIGLLGILILNVKKRYIYKEEAIEILENIKKLKFRISSNLENHFLEMIE